MKKKYFTQIGTREWTFTPANGKGPKLTKASDTPIRRHVKVISQAHPFDPEWTPYFEERKRKLTFIETVKKIGKAILGIPGTLEK